MSLSNQVTVRQQSCKSRASNGPAPPGRFGAKWKSPQTSLIDSHLNPFFHKTGLSMQGFRQGSPIHAFVISNGRKSIEERHTASTEAYSVKMAALFSAITRFAL